MWCRLLLIINKPGERKCPVAHLPDGKTSSIINEKVSVIFFFSPSIKLNMKYHVFLH